MNPFSICFDQQRRFLSLGSYVVPIKMESEYLLIMIMYICGFLLFNHVFVFAYFIERLFSGLNLHP